MSVEEHAHMVHKAIKGLGTDDEKLVFVLTSNPNEHLVQCAHVYEQQHHRTMIADIKGDTSGDYQDLLVGLVTPKFDYRAEVLHKAIAGLGTDEGALVDVLAHANNSEIQNIGAAFQRLYKKSVSSEIKGDTSGHFKKALDHILELKRDENKPYDPARVEHDSKELYKKGEGRLGTNDDFFVDFFTKNPFPHIYAVNQAYTAHNGHNLKKACEKELSGDYCRLLCAIATPKAEYWAERIHHAIAGAGTKDVLLKRAFILNTVPEIGQIGAAYKAIYGKSLLHEVENDTSGWYKKTLAALMKNAGVQH